jgi:hypothetical protein
MESEEVFVRHERLVEELGNVSETLSESFSFHLWTSHSNKFDRLFRMFLEISHETGTVQIMCLRTCHDTDGGKAHC